MKALNLSISSLEHRFSQVAQTIKNLPAMQKTWVLSLGWEDPGKGNGYPFQYSCQENFMDRKA